MSLNEYINYRAHKGVIKNGLGSEKMQIKEMKPVIFSFMRGKSCFKMKLLQQEGLSQPLPSDEQLGSGKCVCFLC